MNSYITIGDLVFRNRIQSVEISASLKEISETASIKLPRYTRLVNDAKDSYRITPGMEVVIKLGYDGNFKEEFRGYVTSVGSNISPEVKCENELWQLKQKQVSKSWRSVTLKDLLEYLIPGVNTDSCYDITLSPYRLDKVSVAQVLQKLKDDLGLTIYFRNNRWYAGLIYFESVGEVNYHFQKNVVARSGDLVFKRKEDVKIKLKAISLLPNNTRITVEVGDEDGEQRTYHVYNITSADELKKQAQEKLKEFKFDGYKGSFDSFGLPVAKIGMIANIQNDRYPEQAGSFFINAVSTTYSSSGFRRKIEPGTTIRING